VSLENFRKQAKLLVRWHRERNYSMGARIRRSAGMIALEQGYTGRAELRQRLKNSPKASKRTPIEVKLAKAVPVLYVSDVQAAADFYREKVGFTIDFLHGEPAFYASVSRDEACIHLRFIHQPMYTAGLREKEQVIAAFLSVANVKALFTEYQTRKVPFVRRLKKEPWGQSSFYRLGPRWERSLLRRMKRSLGREGDIDPVNHSKAIPA
jgi:catechol 2,3-dioxygenase-like lactoylglutathione lyase family enzyme